MEGIDPRDMRAGDPDRHRVAEILRDAAGEGRLDMDELEDRLERAYAAKTYRELDTLVADLPEGALPAPVRPPGAVAGASDELHLKAALSDVKRTGEWQVPARIVATPGMGNVKLDFRRAQVRHRVIEIHVRGGAGNLVLIAPPGWTVDTEQVQTGWGAIKDRRAVAAGQDGVLVRVTGDIGLGTLVVRDARFYEK